MSLETEAAQPTNLSQVPGAAIEAASKIAAILVLLLYACGFLVTSIQHFSYGFLETSPFRPRIFSAGAWFFIFVAIPALMVVENRKLRLVSGDQGVWLRRFSTSIFFYCISCWGVGLALRRVLISDGEVLARNSIYSTWKAILIFTAMAAVVVSDQWRRFPKAIAPIASIGFTLLTIYYGGRDLLSGHSTTAATALWFLFLVWMIHNEMRPRDWQLKLGNWIMSISTALVSVSVFSAFFYPRINPSWGGGAPIPITIYFSKDSVSTRGQSAAALLLDESDAGLYVVGKGGKKAAFVPRNAVELIYYSDDASDFFLTKPQ